MTRIAIGTDQLLVAAGIRRALAGADDLEVVGQAERARELLAIMRETGVEIVLLDAQHFDGGIEMLPTLRSGYPATSVGLLVALEQPETIRTAVRSGADAVIAKSVEPADLATALRQLVGERELFTALTSMPLGGAVGGPSRLTPRETEILALLSHGLTNEEISEELGIAEPTVRSRLSTVYRKLKVANRTAAARYAARIGLVL